MIAFGLQATAALAFIRLTPKPGGPAHRPPLCLIHRRGVRVFKRFGRRRPDACDTIPHGQAARATAAALRPNRAIPEDPSGNAAHVQARRRQEARAPISKTRANSGQHRANGASPGLFSRPAARPRPAPARVALRLPGGGTRQNLATARWKSQSAGMFASCGDNGDAARARDRAAPAVARLLAAPGAADRSWPSPRRESATTTRETRGLATARPRRGPGNPTPARSIRF